jgi:uncharacterized repeat protein (TIGR01451 family)
MNDDGAIRSYLPAWWRHVLVILATLILCSCRAPVLTSTRAAAAPPGAERSAPPAAPVTLAAYEEHPQASMPQTEKYSPEQSAPPQPATEPFPTGTCASCPNGASAGCAVCAPGAVLGPRDEYLCDGGDYGLPAGVRADATVDGLEQEDTVAHYDTRDGRVVVTPSNRVCIYAPRFAAVRRVQSVSAHERDQEIGVVDEEMGLTEADDTLPVATTLQRIKASIDLGELPPSSFRARQQAGGAENLEGVIETYGGLAPYCDLSVVRTGQLAGREMPQVQKAVQAAITWTGDQAAQVVFDDKQAVAAVSDRQAGVVYKIDEPHSPRLRVIKLASTGNALPGEIVEFTLRYDNIGDDTIGNVTIVDNLATRLEYVADSAKGSVDFDFHTQPNGAGSDVLRWEIRQPVQSGRGGVLQFRARVR